MNNSTLTLNDFDETTFDLPADDEGAVTATLVSSQKNQGNRDAVLYLHGYIDYFFHPHVAAQFHAHDMDFHALDMRKYGRSLLPHQKPNYCADVREYFEEITRSIRHIKAQTQKSIFILAHSTGCVSACLYLNEGAEKASIKGLILNSPFLDMPQNRLLTHTLFGISKVITRFKPMATINRKVNRVYPVSIHKSQEGEWDFDLNWKPIEGFPTYFRWAIAIVSAQNTLRKHSNITVPILTMYSARSSKPKTYTPKAAKTDTVLWVKHMRKLSNHLGKNVTHCKIKNAKHDIFLSEAAVRADAFEKMFHWLKQQR